jgi:four helix bundle protein
VKQLESLDAYRTAQELAVAAYSITMSPPLSKHFALSDQIRRAAISVPANIAEGYALGTTVQFIRCLRISLGSAAELRSHLDITRKMGLANASGIDAASALSIRVISILVGLLRKLSSRLGARVPIPVSRVPIKRQNREAAS